MLRVPRPLLRTLNTSMPTSTNTCYCCCPQRSCLCRSFVTARACISLGRRISADTGCAGCRRAERTVQCQEKTHTHTYHNNLGTHGALDLRVISGAAFRVQKPQNPKLTLFLKTAPPGRFFFLSLFFSHGSRLQLPVALPRRASYCFCTL